MEYQQQADDKHRRFWDEHSDFLSFTNLWDYFHEQAAHLTQNKLRKRCKSEFLSFVRLREWRDIHTQLKMLVKDMNMRQNREAATYDQIHRALLTGLLAHVGLKGDERDYLGARNTRFQIFPGSSQFKKSPKWIMAAEMFETRRVYGHTVARIQPQWIEQAAAHLVTRNWFEPHWEKRPAQVAAYEKVSLYGLVINPRRRVNYGPLDPQGAREIFIRQALVEGAFQTTGEFFRHNRQLLEEIEVLEAKSRRRDILVDEEAMYRFYDERLPAGIYSGKAFEKWRQQAERENPRLLFLERDDLMRHGAERVTAAQFPETLDVNGVQLALGYHFEPGHVEDGVTATVPLAALNQLPAARFQWLVPGLLEEKITELIRSLPKPLRRNFVPAPNYARACREALTADDSPLTQAVGAQLRKMTGIEIPQDAWRLDQLPAHLFMHFKLADEQGKVLDQGRDLERIKAQWGQRAGNVFAESAASGFERDAIRAWDFGPLPDELVIERQGVRLKGYPALVVEGDKVALRVLDSKAKAERAMPAGLRRLIGIVLAQQMKYLRKNLPHMGESCLFYAPLGPCEGLKQDVIDAVLDRLFIHGQPPLRDADAFHGRLERGRGELVDHANEIAQTVHQSLSEYNAVSKRLKGAIAPAWLEALQDMREQLDHLVYPGFVAATPFEWLQHYPRYLKALQLRLDKLAQAPDRDRRSLRELAPLWGRYRDGAERFGGDAQFQTFRWMLEELRVSLFAQELKTAMPVSVKRLQEQWQRVAA